MPPSYLCLQRAALINIILHDGFPLGGQDQICIQCDDAHNLGPCVLMLWLGWSDGAQLTSAALMQGHSRSRDQLYLTGGGKK